MRDDLNLIIRRALRHWQVLATLSLGVLLTTALLASSPLLVDTVLEFGLRRTLIDADEPLAANLRLVTSMQPDAAGHADLEARLQERLQARLGLVLKQIVPGGSARWVYPWVEGELLADRRVNLQFYGRSTADLLAHVILVSGQFSGKVRPEPRVVAVLVGENMARTYDLQVGDRLPVSLKEEAGEPDLWIQVAAIARPLDSRDPYWFGSLSPLESLASKRYSSQFGVLIPRDTFFTLAGEWFAPSEVEVAWNVLLEPDRITVAGMPDLRATLAAIDARDMAIAHEVRVETGLDATLEAFAVRAERLRGPLYFLVATVMLLVLYYVAMASALVLRQFQREFAIQRSRGASYGQILRLQACEAVLISAVALLSGPGLALLLVRVLAVAGPLADVAQPDWALPISQASWLAACVGAVACVISLLAPLPAVLRRSIVTYQQSRTRGERPPWWQRLYLDVFVLLAGMILIWRLRIYGSILGGTPVRPQVDWLLLLAPLALLLGSATILLRVFPLLLSLGAHLASRSRGLPVPLALWHAARDPTHIARLVLLLTLAMALGLFSTGLNAALDRNEDDQSRYVVGSDLRLAGPPFGADEVLRATPGVNAVARAWRAEGTLALQRGRAYPTFALLAVEPLAFATITEYRADLADRPMADLLAEMYAPPAPEPVLPLPGRPARLGMWIRVPEKDAASLGRLGAQAKLRTAQGMLFTARLRFEEAPALAGSTPLQADWHYMEARLPASDAPASLHSVWLRSSVAWGEVFPWLEVSDLVLVDEAGQATWIEGWSQPRWRIYGPRTSVLAGESAAHAGGTSLHLDFGPQGMDSWRWYGLQMAADLEDGAALPALISPALQAAAQLEVGERFGTWVGSEPAEFQVVGVVRYFPTLYGEHDAGFLVTAVDPLLSHLNRVRLTPVQANEVFVDIEEGATGVRDQVLHTQAWEAEAVRRAIKADPLALGLRCVTLFGYLLTTVLSLAGFGTHFYMSTRQRETSFGVLRALGLAPRQLYGSLLLEQVLLIFSGLALGTLLGLLLNRLTLPGLPLSLAGRPPVPPFLAQTDWWAVGRIYLTLAAAFLLSLALATGFLWRTRLHRLLRVDEE